MAMTKTHNDFDFDYADYLDDEADADQCYSDYDAYDIDQDDYVDNHDAAEYDNDQLTVSSRGCYGSHPKAERAEEERDQK